MSATRNPSTVHKTAVLAIVLASYFDDRPGHLDRHHRASKDPHIVGTDLIDQRYASAAEDEMHFQHLLSANCFGDHYTRTGIDIKTRELLAFAMLISLGGCEPQAKGHLAANLNVGNDRDVLLSVITQLLPFIGYPAPSTRCA